MKVKLVKYTPESKKTVAVFKGKWF